MFGKTRAMMKELVKLKKESGMRLCVACALKKVGETGNDVAALKVLVKNGKFKKVEDGKCFLCDGDAKYFISISDAMGGIGAVSRSKL